MSQINNVPCRKTVLEHSCDLTVHNLSLETFPAKSLSAHLPLNCVMVREYREDHTMSVYWGRPHREHERYVGHKPVHEFGCHQVQWQVR